MFVTRGLPLTVTCDNCPHFITESFEAFVQKNCIEHGKQRQDHSLQEGEQIAQLEGQDWKKTVQTYSI
jgi:hypothetical protein